MECIDSAREGFNTWSTMSSESKMQILSNFAATLECNGYVESFYNILFLT